jgi:hypothetical protein
LEGLRHLPRVVRASKKVRCAPREPQIIKLGRSPAEVSGVWLYMYSNVYTCMRMNAFETLADPTRRQIVRPCAGAEQRVNDIVGLLDIHQSGVSRHLKILREVGFVRVRPEASAACTRCVEPFRELET